MAQPSLVDFISGVDTTGLTTVSDSQLEQLVNSGTPYTDKGLVVKSTDIATVPQVPDAVATPKWIHYLWKRQQASGVIIYTWDENAASDATYLKWVPVTVASIADGSVTTAKLANGAVTDDKVTSVGYGKLTGAPPSLAPSGPAGGDLTGTYPNPTIGANKVLGTMVISDAAVDANRAIGTNHIKDAVVTPAKLSTAFAGMISPYAGATPPTGWLVCDGTSYATADYLALATAIGYLWGGAGANFNVPDLRGRGLIGTGIGPANYGGDTNPILTNRVIATAQGRETHTLLVGEIPKPTGASSVVVFNAGLGSLATPGAGADIQLNSTYGGGAHANIQPTAVIKWLIKT